MTNRYTTTHSLQTRLEAIRLHSEGVPFVSICARLCVPRGTVHHWLEFERREQEKREPIKVKPKAKSGSGVIAPAPYHRGSLWGAGW